MSPDPIPPTVSWRRGRVRLIDQRALPQRLRFVECATVGELRTAITELVVRGAPALGATGAYGVALAAHTLGERRRVRAAAQRLRSARPTAVNLAHGIDAALDGFLRAGASGALAAAQDYAAADVRANRALGAYGATLVSERARVLTHCNAGALACVGYGTALGVIRAAAEQGKAPTVWVDETRPVLQGARLTAWELSRLGIPYRVIVDGAAGSLMARGEVDLVVVGADRIAANGDVANKIGTYPLAVLANRHGIPFVVAAPRSSIDFETPTGDAITIEDRAGAEVTVFAGATTAPRGAAASNPAFDVTPAALVSAIVTELGVIAKPGRRRLAQLKRASGATRDEGATGK